MNLWRVTSVEMVTYFHEVEAVSAAEACEKVLALGDAYWDTFTGAVGNGITCTDAEVVRPIPPPATLEDAVDAMRRIAAGEPCMWTVSPEVVQDRQVMVLRSPTGETFSAPLAVGDAATVIAEMESAAKPQVLMPHGHKPCQRCGTPTRSDLCKPCGKAAIAEVDDAIRVRLTT